MRAEKRLKKVDFSLLSAMDIASLSDKHFQTLVKDIAEIENYITKICPFDIGETGLKPFECSTAQINGMKIDLTHFHFGKRFHFYHG